MRPEQREQRDDHDERPDDDEERPDDDARRHDARRHDDERREDYDEEMVMFLERDQLVADRRRPLPPARIGGRAAAALWTLRIFVLIVGAMVIYTFCAHL